MSVSDTPDRSPGAELAALRRENLRLRLLERRLQDLFDKAPVMYVVTRNEGGRPLIQDCNHAFLETLGYGAEEVVGRPLADFYSRNSAARLLEGGGYARALEGDLVSEVRELVRKDGEIVSTLLRTVRIVDAEERVIGTQAAFVDITLRKRAEAMLRRSEEKYRSLFEDSPDPVLIGSASGRLMDINRAGVELFGYRSKQEMLGLDLGRDLHQDPSELESKLRELESRGFVKDLETRLRRRDGSEIVVLETTSAERDADGKLIALRAILRDVTLERALEAQLLQSQRVEAVGMLAGGIAHDFNNFLTLILGYAELVADKLPADHPLRSDIDEIRKAGERAASLTGQLLAFARQQVMQVKVLDLNTVIEEVESLLRRTIEETILIQISLDPHLGRIKADRGQLEQILVNLTLNARDAMPEGGRLTIATANAAIDADSSRRYFNSVMKPGSYVRLSVKDDGRGMDEATLGRIFEPFFTTRREGKGTGLGLATVYGIVKQSGGYIWVTSRPDHGSTFDIYLPRIDEAVEPEGGETAGDDVEGGRETILLVEDEAPVRRLARRVLSGMGYRVVEAAGPDEALAHCRGGGTPPDLLLTDVLLPGMNGLDLARMVQSLHPEARVLAISGHVHRQVLGDEQVDPQVPFLAKPFDSEKLLQKVREVLGPKPSG